MSPCWIYSKSTKKQEIFIYIFCFPPDAPKTPTVSTNFSLNITEEHQVNLTCHSDANPPANYSWFKRNQDLHHYHPELTIQWVQSSDEYSCRAENLLGESTIHITCEKLNGDINCKSNLKDTWTILTSTRRTNTSVIVNFSLHLLTHLRALLCMQLHATVQWFNTSRKRDKIA